MRGTRRCRLLHRWKKNLWVDGSNFNMSPVDGTRTCERCGKHQQYFYDSQGGCWVTQKASA